MSLAQPLNNQWQLCHFKVRNYILQCNYSKRRSSSNKSDNGTLKWKDLPHNTFTNLCNSWMSGMLLVPHHRHFYMPEYHLPAFSRNLEYFYLFSSTIFNSGSCSMLLPHWFIRHRSRSIHTYWDSYLLVTFPATRSVTLSRAWTCIVMSELNIIRCSLWRQQRTIAASSFNSYKLRRKTKN
jgi:hypothetical protein